MHRHADGYAGETQSWQFHNGGCRLQEEINQDIDRLVDLKRDIVEVIKAVNNSEYQILLERRYLCFHPWEQIAVDMHYSGKWIQKLHDRSLDMVEEILKVKSVPDSSVEFQS